ncbi:MAG: type II secretion system minor pseudopilin GspK [Rhodoferax sp.]
MSPGQRGPGTRQGGAAILMAMLTLTLVATLAVSLMWQQWRGVATETAQRSRMQAQWILAGALDWARLILREDARQGGPDHLGEPWAIALAPARLSTFLAAQRGEATVADDTLDADAVFLSGHIDDMQGRLNLTNLIENDHLHVPTVAIWQRLFEQQHLPAGQLQALLAALERLARAAGKPVTGGDAAPAAPASPPLWPQTVQDLTTLGLSAAVVRTLEPWVSVLPARTPVNLNTAPAPVLRACIANLDAGQAERLLRLRAQRHLATLIEGEQRLGLPQVRLDANLHGVASRFFRVTGVLRWGEVTMQAQSLVQRDGLVVRTLWRAPLALRPTNDAPPSTTPDALAAGALQ